MTSVETRWPLSLWQRERMDDERRQPGCHVDATFAMGAVLELRGPLDVAALGRALDELLRRHDILRTRFTEDGQVVSARVDGEIQLVDEVDPRCPVPTDSPTPLVVRLMRRSASEHVLSLHLHHLAADPPTLWGTVSELAALYGTELGGPAVPPPASQFHEYVLNELAQARTGEAAARAWWENSLGGKRFARIAPGATAPEFEYRGEILSADEFAALKRLGRTHRGTVFTTMLAALACAMGPQHDSGDLLFSTVFRKRIGPQWRNTLGPCFALTCIPLPAPPPTLTTDYANAVRDTVLQCHQHNRFDPMELRALGGDMASPRDIWTFFEFIPADRPAAFTFGPLAASVVTAGGPAGHGMSRLCIRTRDVPDGSVFGHIGGRGGAWRESAAVRLWRDVADQIRGG